MACIRENPPRGVGLSTCVFGESYFSASGQIPNRVKKFCVCPESRTILYFGQNTDPENTLQPHIILIIPYGRPKCKRFSGFARSLNFHFYARPLVHCLRTYKLRTRQWKSTIRVLYGNTIPEVCAGP